MQKTFIIPGLAMRAAEIPKINNVFVLENPEIGDGINLHVPYAIEELAAIHVKSILRHLHNTDDTHLFVGMSMGGMILSVIAAIYRSTLPPASRFTYVVPSQVLGPKAVSAI
jgi:surfactin synthase thioesterase subunit